MFKAPEHLRDKRYSNPEHGPNGIFKLKKHYASGSVTNFFIVASNGQSWEHVSVSLDRDRCPTWEEMCMIKDLFWDAEDAVIQFHPPKSEYVNNHPYCLHLWKKIGENVEIPPSELVGDKSLSQQDISILANPRQIFK